MAACAEVIPRLSLRAHSEAERKALAWAPFSLGALASLMGVGLAVASALSITAGTPVIVDYWWTRDLYHLRFQGDGLSVLAALAINAVGLLMHLHFVGLRTEDRSHHRAALLLAAQGCAIAVVLSADLVALVFFAELMLVCLWLLASLDAPRQAGRMLATVHIGGLLLLGAVLLMWKHAGDTSLAPLSLLLLSGGPASLSLIAVGVVLGLLPRLSAVPAHRWLASLAKERASAAMIPAILFIVVGATLLLRLLPGSLVLPEASSLHRMALAFGLLTLWWGLLGAWIAMDLAGLAVWLTVAQSGHLLIALGAAAGFGGSPAALRAAVLHVLVAPLALTALWSGASAVAARARTDSLVGVGGLVRSMPVAGVALVAGGLSLAGLPPLAGFHVQRLLGEALVAGGDPVVVAAVLAADLVMALAVVNAFRRAFLSREPPAAATPAPTSLSAQLGLTVAALLIVGLWPAPLLRFVDTILRALLLVSP